MNHRPANARARRRRRPPMRRVLGWSVGALLALAALALPEIALADDGLVRLIVRRAPRTDASERAELRADAGVRLDHLLRLGGAEVVEVPAARAGEALRQLGADPGVAYAERDARVRAAVAPDRLPFALSRFTQQWALHNTGQYGRGYPADVDIDAPEAWSLSLGTGVTVGVVDSGVASAHPDLSGQVVPGRDFVADGYGPERDPAGHGTGVAATIAASGRGGTVGVAPQAQVMSLRALDHEGFGWQSDTAEALDYAGDAGLPVVNVSLSALSGESRLEHEAIASHPGTLYVVAAGNDGLDLAGTDSFPCETPLDNVVCVGASDAEDHAAEFSNYGGEAVDLFAPGVGIYAPVPGVGDGYFDGTSMATPSVAGVAALLKSSQPGLDTPTLKRLLLDTTERRARLADLAVTGGRLNAQRALLAAQPIPATAPNASPCAQGCPGLRRRSGRVRLSRLKAIPTRRGYTAVVAAGRKARGVVRLQRRVCARRGCAWRVAMVRRVKLSGRGPSRVPLGALRPGRYRLAATARCKAGTGRRTAKPFRVR